MRTALAAAFLLILTPFALADPVGVTVDDDAHGELAAVSVYGDAWAPFAVSGAGDSHSDAACVGQPGLQTCWPGVAASGTGNATSSDNNSDDTPYLSQSTLASVSGTGDVDYAIIGVSGIGDVEAWYVAISGTGDADGRFVAVSGSGNTSPSLVSLPILRHCDEQACADVAQGDAQGIYLAISQEGDAQGLVAIAPQGDAEGDGVAIGSGAARGGALGVSTDGGETTGAARLSVDATGESSVWAETGAVYGYPICTIALASGTGDFACTYVGASAFGDAAGIFAIAPFGNATGSYLALAPNGHAQGGLLSFGETASGYGAPVATGDASGFTATSIGGNADATLLALALQGDANALTALALFGDASGNRAISVFGDANGQVFAVSVFGEANGATAIEGCELAPALCG